MSNNSLEIRIEGDSKPYKEALKDAKDKAKELSEKAAKAVEEANKKAQEAVKATDEKTKKAAESAMKEAKKAADKAIAEAKRASKEVQDLEQEAMESRKEAVESVDKLGKKLAVTAVAVGGAVLGTGIAYNSQIEQYKAGFQTMLGSAEKADETLGKLKNMASSTPFELTDLANASTTLLAFGEDVNSLMPDLKMLGDISLGNKDKFNSLALVFGQVKSQGRLMGQDLMQMINAGFNPLMVISEKTGESMESLKDKMSKGQITYEMVADAMRTATSAGGQFYNAMDNQSKTLQGQFSTLKDSVQEFAGEVSQDLSDYLAQEVLPSLIEKMETLKEMWEDGSLQKWLGGAAAAATALGVAIAGVKIAALAKDLYNMTKSMKEYTAATKLGTAAQKAFNLVKAHPYAALAIGIASVTAAIVTYTAVAGEGADATEKLGEEVQKTAEEIKENRNAYNETIKSINDTKDEQLAEIKVVENLRDKLYDLENQLNDSSMAEAVAAQKKKEFNAVANELNNIIPGIIDNIGNETNEFYLQRNEINKLITSYKDLATAKALATAYESKMNAAASSFIDAEEAYNQALKEEEKARKNAVKFVKDSIFDLREEGVTAEETVSVLVKKDAAAMYPDLQAYKDAIENTKQAATDYLKYKEDMEKYADAYTKAMAEITPETPTGNNGNGGDGGDDNGWRDTTNTVKRETEKQKEIISQTTKDILNILDESHKLGIISDKEYYDAIEQVRDRYFEEGGENWQKYTQDIEKYYSDTLNALQEKINNFSQKLQDDAHKTYSTITIYEGETPKTITRLADMDYQNKKLEEQLDLLKQIKEKRGAIPKDALADLQKMEADEALNFLQTMLNKSDAEWGKWASGLEERKRLANEYAKELYADEIEENKEIIDKVKEQWGELPDEFFVVGEDCAKQYGAGLKNALEGLYAEARAGIMSMFSSAPAGVIMAGVSGMGVGSSTTYTDNRTTNIYANGQSPHAIVEADKQSKIYQDHTSTFGG